MWTVKAVADRIEEAADTMIRLPLVLPPKEPTCLWPFVIRDFWEAYGWESARLPRIPPSPGAIDRMDEVMDWLAQLPVKEGSIVWARANHMPWKTICARLQIGRTTAWSWWVAALMTITHRLDAVTRPSHVATHVSA